MCVEARNRVGGRTLSFGGWGDLGATWFWDGEAAIAETVASLGLATYPQVTAGDALFEQPDGALVRLAGNPIDAPAWRLAGGMQALTLELARRLPEGVLRTGTPVQSINFDDSGSVQVSTGAGIFDARMVLIAVPPRLAVESIGFTPGLPSGLVEAARAVHTWMSDTVKAVACYEEPFWRRSGLAGAAISHSGPFSEFHDHSGPTPGQAALFGFARSAHLKGASSQSVAAERFIDQLVRLWGPGAQHPSAVQMVDWSRERFTAGPGPEDPSASHSYGNPVLRITYMDSRLAFASTETAHAFGGHVEGAVLAARRATAQALDVLDRPA